MSTNYIAPIWRMPRNANNTPVDKLSNYSIKFGTTNQVINFDSYTLPDKYTISIWLNPDASYGTDYGYYIGGSPTAGEGFAIGQGGGAFDIGELYFYFGGSTATGTGVILNQNEWSHILLVVDKTFGSQGKIETYLNNNLENTTTSFVATPVSSFTSISIIGANTSTASNWDLSGEISQCCIFDYNLNVDQINYLYNLNNPMAITGGEPILYWPLGDNSNLNAPGSFPNISVGADSVFDFNTTGAWIDCGNNPVFNVGTGDLSISAWVYPTSVFGNDEVCDIGTNGGTRFRLQRRSARIGAYIDSAAGQSSMDGSTTLSINQWYHFVLIKSGVNFFLYLNGSEIPEDTYINSGSFTDTEVAIGQYFGGTGNKWAGELTNIQIWNSALTTVGPNSDLKTLYNNGQPLMTGTQPQEANLQAWYKLNQSANWEADTASTWQIPNAVSAYPQSFDFDTTSNNYIDAGTGLGDSLGTYTGDLTISFWFNSQSANNNNNGLFYIGSFSNAQGTIQVVLSNSGNIIRLANGASNRVTATITSYNDNNWHHFVFIYKAGDINNSTIYIDGSELDPGFYTRQGTFPSSINLTGLKTIIGGYYSSAYTVDGLLSNLELWNTELSSSQVETLYNNGTPLTTAIASANLKAWYKLDNNELFDGTNWSIENQKYPANWSSALDFDGTNAVDLSTISFDMTNNLTLSCWINPAGFSTWVYLCTRGSTGGPDSALNFRFSASGLLYSSYNGGSINTGVSFPINQWSHLAITFNYSTGDVIFYKNGTQTGNTLTFASGYAIAKLSNIGAADGAGNSGMNSLISNFAVWESLQDISELYNNGTPTLSYTNTPTAWWKLDNLNTGLIDNGTGGNDATNVGTVEASTFVSTEAVTSSGMTEQNLVNNNVSVFNGESSGMTTANLVTSNISRTQPYSNYSFNFDAASLDYFDLGGLQGTALQPSNTTLVADGFSVSVWVNLDDTSSPRTFWQNDGLGSTNYYGLIFLMNTGGQLNIGYNNGGAAGSGSRKNYITTAAQITSTGTWYHVVAIYKGIAVTPGLYVNGVEITAFNSPTGSATFLAYSPSAKGSIGVGRNGIQSMEGKISNCACFDRTLTQDEVLNIYNNGVPQDLQTTSSFSNNLAAWWPMDQQSSYYDGTDWVVRDLISGNDGNGANTGNVDDLVGNAPGSDANGSGVNLAIADLVGDMENSKLNAFSINMADYADSVTNPASSGRSTDTP